MFRKFSKSIILKYANLSLNIYTLLQVLTWKLKSWGVFKKSRLFAHK